MEGVRRRAHIKTSVHPGQVKGFWLWSSPVADHTQPCKELEDSRVEIYFPGAGRSTGTSASADPSLELVAKTAAWVFIPFLSFLLASPAPGCHGAGKGLNPVGIQSQRVWTDWAGAELQVPWPRHQLFLYPL